MIDNPKLFWMRVEGLMAQEGISNLLQLSKLVDIPYMTLKGSREREALPGTEKVLRLAEFFGMSMEYLLTGRDPWTGHAKSIHNIALAHDILDADDATVDKVRQILEIVRAEADKQVSGKGGDVSPPSHHKRRAGGKKK